MMRNRASFFVLLGLSLLPASLVTRAQQPPAQAKDQQPGLTPQAQQPAKLSGRVLRAEDGRPLPKATVTLTPEGRDSGTLSTRTDSSGVFEFAEVPGGRYRLTAVRTGYVAETYGQRGGGPGVPIELVAGRHLDGIEIRLQRAGVITGTITDEDHEPVEGIPVRALRVRFSPGGRQQATNVRSQATDDLGNYRLARLAPGSYYVQVAGREGVSIGPTSASGYAPTFYPGVVLRDDATRVQVAAASESRAIDIQVRSAPTYTISGIIVDATPATGRKYYGIGFAYEFGMAMTSADSQSGRFTLRGLDPGEYTLIASVSSEGSSSRRGYRTVKVTDADVSVVIEIGRLAEVRGEVRVEGKGEFSFARLSVGFRSTAENAPGSGAQIDDSGAFRIRELPEGSYTFELRGREDETYLKSARCEGEDYLVQPLTVVADQVMDRCELVIAGDVAQVGGLVTREDQPVAGAVIVLIPQQAERRKIPRHTHTAQTDKNGQYLLRGVIPGDYFAFAVLPREDAAYYDLEFPDRNREQAARVAVKPGEPLALNLKLLTQPR
jgi:hypothetical protein